MTIYIYKCSCVVVIMCVYVCLYVCVCVCLSVGPSNAIHKLNSLRQIPITASANYLLATNAHQINKAVVAFMWQM